MKNFWEQIKNNIPNHLPALLFSLAIIISTIVLGKAIKFRNEGKGTVEVIGLAEKDFVSDLIVWEARYEAQSMDIKDAYTMIERNKTATQNYLISKGMKPEELVFSSVSSNPINNPIYSDDGKFVSNRFEGYQMSQTVTIESKDVEKIEKISREVTELLNQGVQLYSEPPRYYYTKLKDLKLSLVSDATKDAHDRAENIAEYSDCCLDDVKSAKMGVFQITGQNSGEDYSWGGSFNTSDKNKTASITMKITYTVK